jgi:hypothetical protein
VRYRRSAPSPHRHRSTLAWLRDACATLPLYSLYSHIHSLSSRALSKSRTATLLPQFSHAGHHIVGATVNAMVLPSQLLLQELATQQQIHGRSGACTPFMELLRPTRTRCWTRAFSCLAGWGTSASILCEDSGTGPSSLDSARKNKECVYECNEYTERFARASRSQAVCAAAACRES